jgi:hypothetical protein
VKYASSLLLVATLATPALAQRAAGPVHQLGWFAGCWQWARSGSVVDEQWMAPRGGQMLGMARTVRGDTMVTEFEHLQILERNGQAVYHAEPSGQKPADFTAASVSDTLVAFENPEHDFPKRIIYRRRGTDSLIARTEGVLRGQPTVIDFKYVRVACPSR